MPDVAAVRRDISQPRRERKRRKFLSIEAQKKNAKNKHTAVSLYTRGTTSLQAHIRVARLAVVYNFSHVQDTESL